MQRFLSHAMTGHRTQQHLFPWLVAALLLLSAFFAPAQAAPTQTQCYVAGTQGTDGPVDYGAYCWIDFTPLNLATAESAGGQPFQVNLQGGATLTFTLQITPGNTAGTNMYAVPVPSWSGAAFGNTAFNNISGNPILYQDKNNQNNPKDTVTLQNVTLNVNGSSNVPFVFVAADGESTNTGESLQFSISGSTWNLAATPGGSNPGRVAPTLAGVGTNTVTETGVSTQSAASYVFTTSTSPGTVTTQLVGGGLQGVLFGVKYYTVGLSIQKTHVGNFIAGGTGSYNIAVTNTRDNGTPPIVNPPSAPQIVQVVDTLPTGLTYASYNGNGFWTCSAVGQVVTCNSINPVDLTNGGTAPSSVNLTPITLNVNVAANAPATITNNASVAINTTSLIFNVCTVTNNGICPGSATSNTGDPTTILHPNLSTSTKTVTDVNGGDLNPGDVLQYTVNLVESAGAPANNISVVDNLTPDVTNLTVISTPAGSTNSSTTTGGTNGTGQLNISNINIPANGSAQIVYQVTVASTAAPGEVLTNTATANNPDPLGSGASPSASITVKPASNGNKVLYVYTSNNSLTRTPQTGTGGGITIAQSATHDWTLSPVLQKSLTFVGGSTVNVGLLVQCTTIQSGNCRNGGNLHWQAALYDNTVSAGTQIGTTSGNATFNNTTYAVVTASITIPAGGYTAASGHQLILEITNTSSSARSMQIEQYNGGTLSTVLLPTSTVINVDSVNVYNAAYPATTQSSTYTPGTTAYIRAVVSDPFGSYDIAPTVGGTAPKLTIKDSAGATQLSATNMPMVADSGAATKTFEYAYTVPSTGTAGRWWTPSVTATEGTATDLTYNGNTTITHTANGAFDVEMPNLLLMKSVQVYSDPTGMCVCNAAPNNKPHAIPGATLQYSILVTNQGQGTVDANSIKLADTLSTNTSYVVGSASFTDGSPTSGLTFNPATNVSYCTGVGGTTCPYTSGVGAGNPDPAITKINFNPQGIFNGKASPSASAPSFTIQYKVQLK